MSLRVPGRRAPHDPASHETKCLLCTKCGHRVEVDPSFRAYVELGVPVVCKQCLGSEPRSTVPLRRVANGTVPPGSIK